MGILLGKCGPGWWLTYPSEKSEFVRWDDDIPKVWKVIKFMFQSPQIRFLLMAGKESAGRS
jgi:hypothetical protein